MSIPRSVRASIWQAITTMATRANIRNTRAEAIIKMVTMTSIGKMDVGGLVWPDGEGRLFWPFLASNDTTGFTGSHPFDNTDLLQMTSPPCDDNTYILT
jgi:hypothetical protein